MHLECGANLHKYFACRNRNIDICISCFISSSTADRSGDKHLSFFASRPTKNNPEPIELGKELSRSVKHGVEAVADFDQELLLAFREVFYTCASSSNAKNLKMHIGKFEQMCDRNTKSWH